MEGSSPDRPTNPIESLRRSPPEFRRALVTAAQDRSPRLVTIRLEGSDLVGIEVPEPAASIRLLLPRGGPGSPLEIPTWNGNEFRYDDGSRPPIRTLTPLRVDPVQGSMEVDVVLHGRGALSDWAAARAIGDEVAVSGPGRGYSFDPSARRYVLLGDESAVPAIGQILDALPHSVTVDVVIEIARPDARLELPAHPGTTTEWRQLPEGEAPGDELVDAVGAMDLGDDTRIWAAGEAAAVQRLRTVIHTERGVARNLTMIRGYWKHGRDGAGTS